MLENEKENQNSQQNFKWQEASPPKEPFEQFPNNISRNEKLESTSLGLNEFKTKITFPKMKNSRKINIELSQKQIEQFEFFKYLEVELHRNGKHDINEKI